MGFRQVDHVRAYPFKNFNGGVKFLVLGKETDNGYVYEFPGGKREAGESDLMTLTREMQEETGFCCNMDYWIKNSGSLYVPRRMSFPDKRKGITINLTLIPVRVNPYSTVKTSEPHDSYAWLHKSDCYHRLTHPEQRQMHAYMSKKLRL